MVEALVAIPFFIVIFALIMFVGQFYGEKLRTIRESKKCAWDHSMNGCSGGCQADTQAAGSGQEVNPPGGSGDSKSDSAPGSQIMSKDFYQSKFTVKASATASPYVGGYIKPVESTTTVTCDEVPEDGNPAGVAKYLWNNGSAW